MNPLRKIVLTLSLLSMFNSIQAQTIETGFLDRSISLEGSEHKYQVYVPDDYDAARPWPVILFLHGAGERGDDGKKQAEVGLGSAIRANPERWPAITVFPQVPTNESWQGVAGQVAMAALDETLNEFSVDKSRQYLTGLSLGGNGTWYLGYQNPDRFAALVPICGFVALGSRFPNFLGETSSNPYAAIAEQLKAKPVWIVHGDADVVVPVDESRKMAAALETINGNVHYTELPGVNHNAWDPAYAMEELASWLFNQRSE